MGRHRRAHVTAVVLSSSYTLEPSCQQLILCADLRFNQPSLGLFIKNGIITTKEKAIHMEITLE